LPEAAYCFCRYEPGKDVILSGTGNRAHLEANLASFECPPLPEDDRQRPVEIFRGIDSVAGN
jgi:aryl-alcohol dehydrogenase-like predicted oxidoreductase